MKKQKLIIVSFAIATLMFSACAEKDASTKTGDDESVEESSDTSTFSKSTANTSSGAFKNKKLAYIEDFLTQKEFTVEELADVSEIIFGDNIIVGFVTDRKSVV